MKGYNRGTRSFKDTPTTATNYIFLARQVQQAYLLQYRDVADFVDKPREARVKGEYLVASPWLFYEKNSMDSQDQNQEQYQPAQCQLATCSSPHCYRQFEKDGLEIVQVPSLTKARAARPSGLIGDLMVVPLDTDDREPQSGASMFMALGPSRITMAMASLSCMRSYSVVACGARFHI